LEQKRNVKKIVVSCIALVAIIAAMFFAYKTFMAKPVEGSKNIVAEVILTDGTSESFKITTDAEFLREALEKKKLISGIETKNGLYVTTVNGITADESKQEWWNFSLNGESLMTGVDTTPIKDGDHYQITLIVGY
jgi:hypothetical protein